VCGKWLAGTIVFLQRNPYFGEMLEQVRMSLQETMMESDKMWCTIYLLWPTVSGYEVYERDS